MLVYIFRKAHTRHPYRTRKMAKEFPSILRLSTAAGKCNLGDLEALGWNTKVLFNGQRKDTLVAPVHVVFCHKTCVYLLPLNPPDQTIYGHSAMVVGKRIPTKI